MGQRLKVGDRVRLKSSHREGDLLDFLMEGGLNTHAIVRFHDECESAGVTVDINDIELMSNQGWT